MAASKGNQITYFRLKPEEFAWLRNYAASSGKTKTEICRAALASYRKELDEGKDKRN